MSLRYALVALVDISTGEKPAIQATAMRFVSSRADSYGTAVEGSAARVVLRATHHIRDVMVFRILVDVLPEDGWRMPRWAMWMPPRCIMFMGATLPSWCMDCHQGLPCDLGCSNAFRPRVSVGER